jgi:hypothetical protein
MGKRTGRNQTPQGGRYGRSKLCHTDSNETETGERKTMTHERNPAKAYLLRYRALKSKCAALERAIRSAFEDATNITVSLKEVCVQSSGGGERMANSVIKAIDATAYLEEQRQEAARIMCEIMEAIKAVPDDVQQTILIERYINGRLLQDIQQDIHYEKRNTIILHGRALWEVWQYMKRHGLCE